MFSSPIKQVFAKFTDGLHEPSWLQKKRQMALVNFQQLGVPTRTTERWKYTNCQRLENLPKATVSGHAVHMFNLKAEATEHLDVVDITAIAENQWLDIQTDKDRVFVDLNTAMLNAGFQISIAANTQLKLHIHYQQISENWQNIRSQIIVGENARLELSESYDPDCRINHVSVINAHANAQIKRQAEKNLAKTAALIHYSKIICAENVTLEQCVSNSNAFLSHSLEDIDLLGEHSQITAASINVTHDGCQIAENIQINHIAKHCKSKVIVRSLASDKSLITVNTRALVGKNADGSEVAQSLKNILLSQDASINSRPELEINTDDVIAAHGSTTGELDEIALMYLRSRGIDKKQAQSLLLESFLQDANIFNNDHFLESIQL